MKLLTRNDIMEIWKDSKYNDFYCCPHCRDILMKFGPDEYKCINDHCLNEQIYTLKELTGE